MTNLSDPLPDRPIPGGASSVSALGLRIAPPYVGPARLDYFERLAGVALGAGLRLFDLTDSATDRAEFEHIAGIAETQGARASVVVSSRSALAADADAARRSAAVIVETPAAGPTLEPLDPPRSWATRWRDAPEMFEVAKVSPSVPLVSIDASLLQPTAIDAVIRSPRVPPLGLIARNPFASGRLDGSLVETSPLDRDPRRGPVSLAELQSVHAQVAPLGFLVQPHRRNLRVAAVQYLLAHSAVVSVIVEATSVERVEEIARVMQAPELSSRELERIASVQAGARGAQGTFDPRGLGPGP
jgi:hypothetical protein